jgi:hypothetical protein
MLCHWSSARIFHTPICTHESWTLWTLSSTLQHSTKSLALSISPQSCPNIECLFHIWAFYFSILFFKDHVISRSSTILSLPFHPLCLWPHLFDLWNSTYITFSMWPLITNINAMDVLFSKKLDLHTPKTNTLQALLTVWLAFWSVSLILEILGQSFGKLFFGKMAALQTTQSSRLQCVLTIEVCELCGHISTHWVGLIKESLSICHPKHSPFVDMTNSHVNSCEQTNEKYSTFIIAIG